MLPVTPESFPLEYSFGPRQLIFLQKISYSASGADTGVVKKLAF